MKAICYDQYGGPEQLELRELPDPVPGPGELRLRVAATGLNALDWRFLRADPWYLRFFEGGLRRPARPILGTDIAGHVDAVGEGVEGFAVGDAVVAWGKGGMAELCCVPADQAIAAPAGSDLALLSTLPVAGCTALQAVHEVGQLQPGQRVLVNGASGGVGHFVVQVARAGGAEVTGVCSGRNQELVQQLGAHNTIDYTREDFTASGQRYDLVIDCVGKRGVRQLRPAVERDGCLVVIGMDTSGPDGGMLGLLGVALLNPFVPQKLATMVAEETPERVTRLVAMVAAGELRPHIEERFPLARGRDALVRLESGHVRGKLVVCPGG